jgi:hypothetical protein
VADWESKSLCGIPYKIIFKISLKVLFFTFCMGDCAMVSGQSAFELISLFFFGLLEKKYFSAVITVNILSQKNYFIFIAIF